MIDPKELRIYNLIKDVDGNIRSVARIGYVSIWIPMPTGIVQQNKNDLFPIELTPEILTEWCGFKKSTYFVFYKRGIEFVYEQQVFRYYTHGEMEWLDVDYLHDLQNLFFVLKGNTELEIKIPERA